MKKHAKKLKLFFLPSKENNYKAPFILSGFLLSIILVLFLLKIGFFFFLFNFPKINLFADISKSVLVSLTNQTRQSSGLSVLNEDSRLNQAAYLKAQDMINYDYFAHTSPSGKSPWSFVDAAGYNYQYAGENLAMDFLDSGEVFQAWLNSSVHKANIVNSKFRDIGMAVLTGEFQGRETTVVVQFFGTPLNVPAATAKEPSAQTSYTQPKRTIKVPSQPSVVVTAPMTLYDYFRQKGQAIPSMQDRAALYESFSLGLASSYQGLSWQNALLVNKLLESEKAKETAAQPPVQETPVTTMEPTITPTTEVTQTPVATSSPTETKQPIFPAAEIKISPPPNSSFSYKTINFIAQNYDGITKNIFVIVFGVVFLSVCVDVAAKSSFKNAGLILRGTIYSIALLGLFFLDKAIIIKIIPHSFSIL